MNPNENTGRWTQEEHERFLQGLELFGKKWTKATDQLTTPRSTARRLAAPAARYPPRFHFLPHLSLNFVPPSLNNLPARAFHGHQVAEVVRTRLVFLY